MTTGRRRLYLATPALILGLLLLCAHAQAADILSSDITQKGARYHIDIVAVLDVPRAQVLAIIAAPERFAGISPTIHEARLVESLGDGRQKRAMRVKTCMLLFCFDFLMTEVVTFSGDGQIHTRLLPEESDFRFGKSHWQVVALSDSQTRIEYTASREPRFWIPPIIGPIVMQAKVSKETRISMLELEQRARELAASVRAESAEAK